MAVIITLKKFQERKKERKVRLESEGKSEDSSLDPSCRFQVDSYLPIIDQTLSSMKILIEAFNHLQKTFVFDEIEHHV